MGGAERRTREQREGRLRGLLNRAPEAAPGFAAAVIEHLADGVVACDAEGNFVTLNRRARESVVDGIPRPSFPKHLPMDKWAAHFRLHPRGSARLLTTDELPLVRALRGETVRDMVLETRGEGGARAVLNVSGGPVLDDRGEIQGAVVVIQDITERVEVDDRLWLQSAIVANIEAGVALLRAADGEIVYVNDRWNQMFGYERGELVGKPISVVNAPTNRAPEERAREIMGALHRNGTWAGEVHNVRKDGSEFWCEASVSRFEHPTHGTLWVAAHTEIGGRKAAEEALQRSELRFRTVFEQSPVGIALVGSRLQLIDFNDAFCEVAGYRREALVGMPMAAIGHPDDRDADTALLEQLFSGEIPRYRVARRYEAADGRTVPVTITATLAHAADGEPLYAITTVERDDDG